MPTYDYKCDACGHVFEKFHSITAAPIRKCPVCGKRKVKRLLSTGAGLIFKGSGFYTTDYRSESYKTDAKADKPATTDAKPAEKSAPAEKAAPVEKAAPAAKPAASQGKSSTAAKK